MQIHAHPGLSFVVVGSKHVWTAVTVQFKEGPDLLQNSKFFDFAFEILLELEKPAQVLHLFHWVQEGRVDEGWAQDIDADAVVALGGGVLQVEVLRMSFNRSQHPRLCGWVCVLPLWLWWSQSLRV